MTALQRWLVSLTATTAATSISYRWLDQPIALFFHAEVPHYEPLARLNHIPDPLIPLAIVTFIGLTFWNLSGRLLLKCQAVALACSISVIVTEAIKTQLKFVFGRSWPETWIQNNPSFIHDGTYGFNLFHGGAAYASFPSGHMAATCAVISVLWIYYPKNRAIYLFLASAIGMGLVGAGYHFLSDVIAGAFVGASIGWMTTALWPTRELVDAK